MDGIIVDAIVAVVVDDIGSIGDVDVDVDVDVGIWIVNVPNPNRTDKSDMKDCIPCNPPCDFKK